MTAATVDSAKLHDFMGKAVADIGAAMATCGADRRSSWPL